MFYIILAYIVFAAFFNQYHLRKMNIYINDREEDKVFDDIRNTHTEEEIQNIKKTTYKVTVFLLSAIWPISLIIDGYLYLKHRHNEPKT